MMLFSQIERGFNDVYHVRRRRHVWTIVTSYFMILILAPLGIGYSLALSTFLDEQFAWVSTQFTSMLIIALILSLAYWLVPNTRVRLPFALVGGLAASALWELAKKGFLFYVVSVPSVKDLLFSIGVIPLFLVWLFTTWLVIFFGLELCYVLQHYRPLAGRLLQRGAPLELNPRHLLTALYEMGRRFDEGDPQVSVQDLMRATNLDENSVHVLLDHCEEKGWVMPSVPHAIYHIAKPAERIELGEVLLRPVSHVIDLTAPPSGRGLDDFWQEYHRSVERSLPAKTLRDLLNSTAEGQRAKVDAS
jgi:membrane protein